MKSPNLFLSLLPILFLILFLGLNVYVFGDDGLSGSNQLVLTLASLFAGLLAVLFLKIPYEDLLSNATHNINEAIPSILILLAIGGLSGTWLVSGIIPTMIYYGLQILNPSMFLGATLVICAIVSVATGSSWSTIATIGIALLGIGKALQIHEGLVAGAIISGAYFGDKISPMSDTTNLAAAITGTELFTHIRYMSLTTIPSIVIALIAYLVIGFSFDHQLDLTTIQAVQHTIAQHFNISPFVFITPTIVAFLIYKKVPALPTLLIGTLLATLFTFILQPQLLNTVIGVAHPTMIMKYKLMMQAIFGSIQITTNNDIVNSLLASGGMSGMLHTIWLIIVAMAFGGIMQQSGMLQRITELLLKKVTTEKGLFGSTTLTCLLFNLITSDQYLSIVIPGKMYQEAFKKRHLAPENLSRTLEDTATVTSVLIPWNTCGVAQSSILNVSTLVYLPYCFFNWISPLMTLVFAYGRIKIRVKG